MRILLTAALSAGLALTAAAQTAQRSGALEHDTKAIAAGRAVKSFTLRDPIYRLSVQVGVAYDSDPAKVRATLERVAKSIEWRDPGREPAVLLSNFGGSSVDYEVSVWTGDAWRQREGRSMLREAIWEAMRKERITIAFPQLDLHLDPQVTSALASLRRAA